MTIDSIDINYSWRPIFPLIITIIHYNTITIMILIAYTRSRELVITQCKRHPQRAESTLCA